MARLEDLDFNVYLLTISQGGGGVGKEEQDPVPLIFGNPVLVERDAEARPRTEQ